MTPAASDGDLLLAGARLVAANGIHERGWVRAQRGRIAAFGSGTPPPVPSGTPIVDAGGLLVGPGLVDTHVHGAGGAGVMDATPAALTTMGRHLARHGVTGFLATTLAAPAEATLATVEAAAEAMADGQPADGARLLGVHLEGPWLNPRRVGAQDPVGLRTPEDGEAARLLDTGTVRIVTLAPELPGADRLVAACVERGVRVSAGHTDATYDALTDAVRAGVSRVTHTFNAMRPLHHREPGAVGAALTLTRLHCEVVADGTHVHPSALRLLLEAKGLDKVVLVSDAVAAGAADGETVEIAGATATCRDGALRRDDGRLAGGVATLDACLRHLVAVTGGHVTDLWHLASRNAAETAGVAGETGCVRAGLAADFVALNDDLDIAFTIVGGRLVHDARNGA